MEKASFEKTQRYLLQLLGYLEGVHSSMDWASIDEEASPFPSGLPPRIETVLMHSGFLEGMSLKAQGCLSSDIQEFIRTVGMAFEIEAIPQGAFKLPFIEAEIAIQRKTLNDFMEKAWQVYHAALLSAYALRPLRFQRSASSDGLEETVRIVEASTAPANSRTWESIAPGALHTVNNSLSGILGYVTLILEERKTDVDLQNKLSLVLEATKQAASAIPTT
jgi:hypothetical protein